MFSADYSQHFETHWDHAFVSDIAQMALLCGLQKKADVPVTTETVEPKPFTLFPSALPKTVLQEAVQLQTSFQTLMYRVANDHDFLTECLKDVLHADEFTNKLWKIYETVRCEGATQDVSVMLTRNDYLLTADHSGERDMKLKQVEFNTISVAIAGLSSAIPTVHRYSLSHARIPFNKDQVPGNVPVAGLAKGLVEAHKLFKDSRAVMLFVVDPNEVNTPDQRWLEREILQRDPQIQVVRRTFNQLLTQASLDKTKNLIVDGHTVGLVYYRYGYDPAHYPSEKEYSLRLLMERSRAIKCPSIAIHLAGCKKVQQALSKPDALERFLPDMQIVNSIRDTHVEQFTIDGSLAGDEMFTRAIENPERYVLKPQREGSEGNLFDDDLKSFLLAQSESRDLSGWVLMERIPASPHRNILIKVGTEPVSRPVISELGVFGVLIGTPSEELANYDSGYLLRTKSLEAMHKQACVDSPFLV